MACYIDIETKKILDCVTKVRQTSSQKESVSLKEIDDIAKECDTDVDEVLDVLISSGIMKIKK